MAWVSYERIFQLNAPLHVTHRLRCLVYDHDALRVAITKRGPGARKDARRFRRFLRRHHGS